MSGTWRRDDKRSRTTSFNSTFALSESGDSKEGQKKKKERLIEMYIVNVNKQKAASERLSGRFKELHPI